MGGPKSEPCSSHREHPWINCNLVTSPPRRLHVDNRPMSLLPNTPWVPGYPVDCRPPAQVARRAASPIGDFEAVAARVVARLTGALVFLDDDGSQDRMPDIRIEYWDCGPSYGEVWTDTDPQYAAMHSRLMKPENRLPLELTEPGLSRVWWVAVSGTTNVDRLEKEIGKILKQLERSGMTFEDARELARYDEPRVTELLRHGVVRVSSRPRGAGEPGTIRLSPGGISGSATTAWAPVADWLSRTLFSERLDDVRSKLAATGSPERHLFLGVTFSSPGDVFFALSDSKQSLPDEPPDLPREITHLWLMRAESPGRCIAWFPDRGWFNPSEHWVTA